jgi:hypothetical protein
MHHRQLTGWNSLDQPMAVRTLASGAPDQLRTENTRERHIDNGSSPLLGVLLMQLRPYRLLDAPELVLKKPVRRIVWIVDQEEDRIHSDII